MKIEWLGQSAFILTASDGTKVLTDPYQSGAFGGTFKYGPIKEKVDIVTVSHGHADHSYAKGLAGSPQVIDAAGKQQINSIKINGIQSAHDTELGKQRGENIIFAFEIDGIRLAHFGDLGHILTAAQTASLGRVDIALLPVGGIFTIDAKDAAIIMECLKPKITIPMHFKTEKIDFELHSVEKFLKGKLNVRRIDQPVLEVTKEQVEKSVSEIVVLQYSH